LASWLTGSASYTWTDATITKDNTGTGLLGKQLVYVPRNMASLGLRAQYQNWSGNLGARYSGLMYTNASNSDVEKEVFSGSSKYWLTDLKIGYRFAKNIEANLIVNNLLDKVYYEYYRMPGRNVAIELAAKF
jgi:iron complex outermembrane receptor protein